MIMLEITPIQYIDCTFLNLFECVSEPDSSLDIVEVVMPEVLNTTMTCNGMVTDNYRDVPFDVTLGDGQVVTVTYSQYNLIITVIDGMVELKVV